MARPPLRIVEGSDDDPASVTEGTVTLWSNLLTLMGQYLVESGTPKPEILEMLRLLNDTNDATIRSPRVRALASRRLMAVYTAFETS
ncbi:hypothetical protein HZF05_09980 [Sphingomonas sp. CGMCC 1.13654]|uniref:Uncharacterized protein n=1 Tax=Sphingomonas chungangi TaxID=2683589 RepID=A0A838L8F7_9SPHN|nr:hypothetical protein [Sphingomonas chungangi]MBA2934426.1 hypothetical protein [Sphingomonas chungangi]MVW57465.1 hypothetical protein [Sphingomonas chungangi]